MNAQVTDADRASACWAICQENDPHSPYCPCAQRLRVAQALADMRAEISLVARSDEREVVLEEAAKRYEGRARAFRDLNRLAFRNEAELSQDAVAARENDHAAETVRLLKIIGGSAVGKKRNVVPPSKPAGEGSG